MRAAVVASLMMLAPVAWATPYRVEFVGRVTALGANAPDSFFVGEEVLGSFLYEDGYESWVAFNSTATTFDDSVPIPSPAFEAEPIGTLVLQLFQGAGIAVETESGFRAEDRVSEYLWSGRSGSTMRFTGQDDRGALSLTSGRVLSNQLMVGSVIDATTALRTLAGPVTTGLHIDLTPGEPDLRTTENDLVEATFQSLSNPDQLRPTGGSILFEGDELNLQSDRGSVEFEITDFVIRAVPEPHTLLLLACLAPLSGRRR